MPVIGVAKTPFRTATHATAALRGTSARPLQVTAATMAAAPGRAANSALADDRPGRCSTRCAGPTPWPATACPSRDLTRL